LRRLSRIAWLGIAAGAICCAGFSVSKSIADEALDAALKHRADGYLVHLTVTRQGSGTLVTTARKNQKTSTIDSAWSFGPTHVTAHLVPWISQSSPWNATAALHRLARWEQEVDQELARIQQVRLAENHPMRAFADEDERVTRAAAARQEDVAALIRLLHGLEEYVYIAEGGGDPAQPISRSPEVTFGGGSLSTRIRDFGGEEETDVEEYPAWSGAGAPLRASDAPKTMDLVVWQFDPSDMARARALIADLATVTDELTYRGENIRTDLIDKRINLDWKALALVSHARFRDALAGALGDVARYAWTLAPQEPPAGLFGEGSRAQLWLGDLAPNAKLSLPEVSGNRLMRLAVPVGGMNAEHLDMMGGSWIDSSRMDFTWHYDFPPQWLWGERPEDVKVLDSESSGTEHNVFMKNGVLSLIDAAFSDDRVTGTVTQAVSHQATSEGLGNGGMEDNVEQAEDQVSLQWSVTHEPAPASPEEEPMTLSFARPLDGKAVPFEASEIDYGEAFYVEGRLEKPATRKVYRVQLEVTGGAAQDVFLRPVEGDPTLVRSEVLYVMWDVAKQGAAP
jgi:hypothetical protein